MKIKRMIEDRLIEKIKDGDDKGKYHKIKKILD